MGNKKAHIVKENDILFKVDWGVAYKVRVEKRMNSIVSTHFCNAKGFNFERRGRLDTYRLYVPGTCEEIEAMLKQAEALKTKAIEMFHSLPEVK